MVDFDCKQSIFNDYSSKGSSFDFKHSSFDCKHSSFDGSFDQQRCEQVTRLRSVTSKLASKSASLQCWL